MKTCRVCGAGAVCEVWIEGIPPGGNPPGMYPCALCAEHKAVVELEPREVMFDLEPESENVLGTE